ncbi:MAG: ABC transporter ATP-binding protein [Planctomycetota bacterium]
MNPVIRMDHVNKRFRKHIALDDVSLEVPAGVVCALLGENGAGKTTTMRILLGLADPDSGSTEVLGMNSRWEGQEIRRRIGYVPERPTLYDWMTIDEIGWFVAGFYGGRFLENYQKLARGLGLELGQKIKEISKGGRAKVCLALAQAHEPALLLLDEPTSGLDPIVRHEFLESMVDVAAAGRTVFLCSHQIAEVERVADCVAILRHGRLVLFESLDNLKANTRELTVTMENGKPLGAVPGTTLQRIDEGRQSRLLVHGVGEEDISALRQQPGIQSLEAKVPSLEQIYVGYMHDPKPTRAEA